MEIIILAIITFISTLAGGLLAIKFKNRLHLIMGFTAGVLLGVVAFDILPEIMTQVSINKYPPIEPMIALVIGFLLFHILEKTILIHHTHETDYAEHKHPQVGVFSALALIGHSFMDGISIGFAFQVNQTVGLLVAIAVVSHDFTDGMNTITFMLANKNNMKKSKMFLFFDALAPVLGVLSTFLFIIPPHFLIWYLGFFAGFLLYIGASDILPEAHSKHSSPKLICLTCLGVLFIFIITRLV